MHLSGQNEKAMATWRPDHKGQVAVLLGPGQQVLQKAEVRSLLTAENNCRDFTDQL